MELARESTESLSSSKQSLRAEMSLGGRPWAWESLRIWVAADLTDERVTERAVVAKRRGLVWMELAWIERDEKQSRGYLVEVQEVLMNCVLLCGVMAE